jgi:hypothetical protein
MKSLFTILLALAPALALAQTDGATVWRCGADGRSYSSVPCAEGRAVLTSTSRPAQDVQAAQAAAEREKQWADRLQSERAQRDNVAPGTGFIGIYHRNPKLQTALDLKPQVQKKKQKRQHHRLTKPHPDSFADHGTFQATAKASRRTRG